MFQWLTSSPLARLMRLHQPTGIWLLLWPCWWSVALHSHGLPDLRILALFALGAVLMRGAGCIVNDLWDRDIDRHVERTKTRPLASGELKPTQAIALLVPLLALSLLVALELGWKVVIWSAASLPLVVLYPLMKRITGWPQAFLGLTFNWGVLLGSVAVTGEITREALVLYTGCFFWTLAYDTIYAHQDKADDSRIGVRSTALTLLRWGTLPIGIFQALAQFLLMIAGFLAHLHPSFVLGCLALAFAMKCIFSSQPPNLDDPAVCRRMFKIHAWLGIPIFLGYLSGAFLR